MKRQELIDIAERGSSHDDYNMRIVGENKPFPFFDRDTKTVRLAYANCYSMEHKTDSKKHHNVVVAYVPELGENGYYFWCGDTFLEGKVPISEAEDRVLGVASGKHMLQKDMLALRGTMKTSSGCRFWAKKTCSHTNHVLANIGIETALSDLEATAGTKGKTKPTTLAGLPEQMARCAFRKHLLIEGDKGSGKTFSVYAFADANKIQNRVQMAGHEGVEAIDLIGHYVQTPSGMVWKDGKLSRAFRLASRKQRTLLFVDEIGRIPRRELNILVGALSPDNDKKLHLSTGRVAHIEDGIAVEETVTCEAQDLWVVATTNVGAGYDVDTFDEALADRFRIVRKDTDETTLRVVLEDLCDSKGFKASVVDRLVRFWELMGEFRAQGTLTRIVDLRHLVEAVEMADKEVEIKPNLADTMLSWVERDADGHPVEEQIDAVMKILTKAWK